MSCLTVIGGGAVGAYRAMAQQLGIAGSVHFTGWLDQAAAAALLAEADALVLPAYDEGLPLVILEAMATGVPVICTPVGAIPEVFDGSGDRVVRAARATGPGWQRAWASSADGPVAGQRSRRPASRLRTTSDELHGWRHRALRRAGSPRLNAVARAAARPEPGRRTGPPWRRPTMIGDARSIVRDTTLHANVCIVGGGPAGITLALQLRDSGLRVILLESGAERPDAVTQALYRARWRTRSLHSPPDRVPAAPVRRLDHASGAAAACRSIRSTSQHRPWIGHAGWPIGQTRCMRVLPRRQRAVRGRGLRIRRPAARCPAACGR